MNNKYRIVRAVKQKHNFQNLNSDRKNSATKIKRKKNDRYEVYFTLNYIKYNLGIFETKEEADEVATLARAMFMPYSEQDVKKYGFMNEDMNMNGAIYFRYGVMGAGKSAMLLKSLYIYDRMGKKYLLLTSKKDDRYNVGYITSRNGNSRKAIAISDEDNILDGLRWHNYELDYIIIDEWHLFNPKHVEELVEASLKYNITVICYGLMLNYLGEMFESSKKIVEVSHKIQQIPFYCELCKNNLATHHLLSKDGEYIFDGDEIFIGDKEYQSVCYDCFYKTKNNKNKK